MSNQADESERFPAQAPSNGFAQPPQFPAQFNQPPNLSAFPGLQSAPQYPPTYSVPSYPPYGLPPGVSYGMPPMGYNHNPYVYDTQIQPQPPKSSTITQMIKKFALNQEVEVCVRGNLWAMGVVVGALKLWDKITGGIGYDVRYTLSGESRTDTFPPNAMRIPRHY